MPPTEASALNKALVVLRHVEERLTKIEERLEKIEAKTRECCGCLSFMDPPPRKLPNQFTSIAGMYSLHFTRTKGGDNEVKAMGGNLGLYVPHLAVPKGTAIEVEISPPSLSYCYFLASNYGQMSVTVKDPKGNVMTNITVGNNKTLEPFTVPGAVKALIFEANGEALIHRICVY